MKNIHLFRQVFPLIFLLICFPLVSPAQLSGTYTIGGTSPDYLSFGDALTDLASQGVSGATEFVVRDGTYSEQVLVPHIAGISAVNRVVFRSQSGDPDDVILEYASGTSTQSYTLAFDGASYVSFRDMTISGLGSSYRSAVAVMGNVSYNEVSGCKLNTSLTTTTSNYMAVLYGGDHDAGCGRLCQFLQGQSDQKGVLWSISLCSLWRYRGEYQLRSCF